jgi:aryl-alcohol dehydrogenase-like predicted oxidoreductase
LDEVRHRVEALEHDTVGISGTLAQRALRFVLAHPAVSTVITGMRRVATVESNCMVSEFPPLTSNELAILRRHAWMKNYYR